MRRWRHFALPAEPRGGMWQRACRKRVRRPVGAVQTPGTAAGQRRPREGNRVDSLGRADLEQCRGSSRTGLISVVPEPDTKAGTSTPGGLEGAECDGDPGHPDHCRRRTECGAVPPARSTPGPLLPIWRRASWADGAAMVPDNAPVCPAAPLGSNGACWPAHWAGPAAQRGHVRLAPPAGHPGRSRQPCRGCRHQLARSAPRRRQCACYGSPGWAEVCHWPQRARLAWPRSPPTNRPAECAHDHPSGRFAGAVGDHGKHILPRIGEGQ